jgi:uncharacterized protein (DUF2267 family)
MDMKSFCAQVMTRARFGNEEEAERTAVESVAVLARSLPHALAAEVAQRLPAQLGETMRTAAGDGGGSDLTGDDFGPDAGMPEDWPAITPDEPFDWGVWGGLPDGEGVHHADPTQEPSDGASEDPVVDAQDFIGPAINMMETESGHDSALGGRDLVSVPMGDDAITRVAAVLSTVCECVGPDMAARIREALPEEVAEWLG